MLLDSQIKQHDIDTLKSWIRLRIGGYKIVVKDIAQGQTLFRGVRIEEKKRPDSISRISYPPTEMVRENGRANRTGQSMFYCSAASAAVFYELHAREGDLIALSEWEIMENIWLHNLGYHTKALRKIGGQNHMRQQYINPIPNETKKK